MGTLSALAGKGLVCRGSAPALPQKELAGGSGSAMATCKRKKQKNCISHIRTNHVQLPFSTPLDGFDGAAPKETWKM